MEHHLDFLNPADQEDQRHIEDVLETLSDEDKEIVTAYFSSYSIKEHLNAMTKKIDTFLELGYYEIVKVEPHFITIKIGGYLYRIFNYSGSFNGLDENIKTSYTPNKRAVLDAKLLVIEHKLKEAKKAELLKQLKELE